MSSRYLCSLVMLSATFLFASGCDKSESKSPQGELPAPPSPPVATLSFANDVNPILKAKCSPCHSTAAGPGHPKYVDDEQAVRRDGNTIAMFIQSSDPGVVMPPLGTPTGPLTDAEKSTLLKFLGK